MGRLQKEMFGRGGAAAQPAHQGGHSAPEDMKCKADSKVPWLDALCQQLSKKG